MIGRRQLPVSSTITAGSLVRAIAPAIAGGSAERAALRTELERAYRASGVALVDSGTSALAMALRSTTAPGGTVAMPAYVCVDLGAAALFASVRVRLYDVDPHTLSPDLASVERALAAGATTVVVAHLYGYPADVPGVAALAAQHGASVIEDAAQGAWGSLSGTRLGAFGPLSVLSFGRGKGMTGGGGGALLGLGATGRASLEKVGAHRDASAGDARTLVLATAQWMLGRPSLYALPSSIPSLHLGETLYHPAHEPREITAVSASLVRSALARAGDDLTVRARHAAVLDSAASASSSVEAIRPIAGSAPGYLRYAVRLGTPRAPAPELGVLRGYPETLAELPEIRELLVPSTETLTGSRELQRSLVTLPTHSLLSPGDVGALERYLTRT